MRLVQQKQMVEQVDF